MATPAYLVDVNGNLLLSDSAHRLQIAEGAASYEDVIAQGLAYSLKTATAVASVTAIPTTAVALAIYNSSPDGGPSVIIDRVWALMTVNSAAVAFGGIIGLLGQTRVAAPSDSGILSRSRNGLGGKSSIVISVTSTTVDAVTGVAAGWEPLGQTFVAGATSLPGMQQTYDVSGRIIVPPGRYFCLHTLASVTSCSAQMGVDWHERQLPLGL